MCGAGVGMRFGLKTQNNSSTRISAFSLSVEASELSARRRGGGESLIRNNDFVLSQRDPFVIERFCSDTNWTLPLFKKHIRWDGSGSLRTQEMTILYSGGEKHDRGVGFVIKNSILPNVVRFEPINDRICYVELKGKWFNILLINCYALTEEKSEEIKNAFYEELDRIYDALPTGKPKITLGDFNAKMGKEETYRPTIGKDSLHNDTNDNEN
ncbi:hypothetical protein QTP88_006193 [Uroleucon formosanum]